MAFVWKVNYLFLVHLYKKFDPCSMLSVRPTVFRGKFCQFLRASSQNSANCCGKIVQILCLTMAFYLWINWALFCQKLQLLKVGFLLSYASNIQRKLSILFSKFKSNCVCLWLCAILRWLLIGLRVLGRLVWFFR